jgi:eukaryotic-like serine/threonine-protein kinase
MTLQGRVLGGRYALGALVGAGGMGQVYRARDRVLQRTVAVKVLSAAATQDLELVARFGREARAAAALNHPNIVTVFDSGADGDLHYLVTEYVEGQSLAGLLRQEGVLEPRRAAEVGRLVCQALAAAHAAGLVHRDITPGNVLVDPVGVVKVADFGIAKLAAATTMTGDKVLGTAAYLAPEQAQGRSVDGRSDLYALGCVLYALVTGAPPFAGDSPVAVAARQVTEQPVPPSERNPRVGAALEAVILTALAKDPADRYQSAATMAQDLDRIVADTGAGGPPLAGAEGAVPTDRLPSSIPASAATVPMASAAVRRPGWVRWALVGAVAMVALVAVALWPRGGDPPAAPQPARPAASTAAPTTTTSAGTTSPTRSQGESAAALANLAQVISAGQQQGTVDNSAEDVLKQAEEVLRGAQEGKGEDVDKKLQDLQRKTDEQIDKGKIRGQPLVRSARRSPSSSRPCVRGHNLSAATAVLRRDGGTTEVPPRTSGPALPGHRSALADHPVPTGNGPAPAPRRGAAPERCRDNSRAATNLRMIPTVLRSNPEVRTSTARSGSPSADR